MQQLLFCVSYFFLRRKDSAAVQPLLQGAFDLAQAFHQGGVNTPHFPFRMLSGMPILPMSCKAEASGMISCYWFVMRYCPGFIEKIHPHMFRHTFVSILLSNPNIGVATVAAEAGHAQPSTTLAIYTQVYDRRRDEIRKQMSRELYK